MRAAKLGSMVSRGALGASLVVCLMASATGTAFAQTERAWDLDETPHAQKGIPAQIGSNVRDGLVGVVDSIGQGAFSAFALVSPYGALGRKALTFGGDVIGLVDNNPLTEHVLNGVLSRHLLRFGAGSKSAPKSVAFLHDQDDWDTPMPSDDAYVGRATFRTEAYIASSTLVTTGAVVVSDLVVRPLGSLVTIFGARGIGDEMDEWGLDLIEAAMKVRFL